MARGRVRLNSRGMRDLFVAPGVRDMLTERMSAALAAARASAPVESGAYRDGLTVYQDTTDRAAVRLGSTADHAPLVEANTGTLARALDAAGGD